MVKKLTFDHLDETDFEEFCYDLLKVMGFVNVSWRKGTGLSSSPSDHGRDIEAAHARREIDGAHVSERWFIESKHYKQGVPPTKIQGALAWAEAERPDVLLLIASNFFSNPTKEYLAKYQQNTKPSFRIKLWENPQLRDNSKGKPLLLSKYSLEDELEFINIMHPAHLEYIKSTHLNTLDYFFEMLDELQSDKRDEIAGWLYMPIIQPRSRKATHKNEKIGDLFIDDVTYDTFKKRCYEILDSGFIPEWWFTGFIVSYLLQATFAHGDTTAIGEMVRRNTDLLEYADKLDESEPNKERFKKHIQKMIDEMPNRMQEGHRIYRYFCDEVVSGLLLEPPPPLEKAK